jgi:hypothetical protein
LLEEKVMPGPSVDPPLITHIGVYIYNYHTMTSKWYHIKQHNWEKLCFMLYIFFLNSS